MARLKDASRKAVRTRLSPSADDNAATQQLLDESHSPLADLPPPSSVLGANLLNAARMNPPSSIPERMVRKNGPGKLKPVSIKNQGSRQNLAVRGDPYEIELSPEKGRYALPVKVNPEPLKIFKKSKKKTKGQVVEVSSELPVASSELPEHEGGDPQVDPEEQVDNLALSEDMVSAEPDVRSSPPGPGPPGNDTIAVSDLPRETPPSTGNRPTDVPEHRADTQTTPKRKSESDHSEERPTKYQRAQRQMTAEPLALRTSHPQVQIPARRKSQGQNKAKTTRDNNDGNGTQESVDVGLTQKEQSRPVLATQKPPAASRRQRADGTTTASQQLPARNRGPQACVGSSKEAPETANAMETESAPVPDDSDHESEHDLDADRSGSIADKGDSTVRPTGQPGSIETVFEFLNLEPRPGRCETKLGASLRRICNEYSIHLQDSDVPTEQVANDANELQETLRKINTSVKEKDRRAFKGDAYGYVFRAVTLYLEALYTWLQDNGGTVAESLEAMRILSPIIHQILAFKDTIADWNVSVPQRFKGDRIIKDVDISLIAHLRRVDKTYRRRLRELEATEQQHKLHADFERKMKEKQEEEDRKAKYLEARTERWKRWQDLHIKRMLCEPEPRRRSKLAITRLEDWEEKDANGVVFERLPVFRPRSDPPHCQASILHNSPEWTEQEETALLDGLKHCAGPQVFEKIFTTYCHPKSNHPLGGHLRNRSVAEIVTRAAQLRSDLQNLYRDNGWKVEDWINKIPLLP